MRHAHVLTRDLVCDPAPEAWATPSLAPAIRVVPLDGARVEELDELWSSAFPPGHVDRPSGSAEDGRSRVGGLLDGALGPVLDVSGMALDVGAGPADPTGTGGRVVAACIVARADGEAPHGGPWVGELMRLPGERWSGLGAVLLRRALALATGQGLPALTLVVTEGNPARGLYERLGFRQVLEARTLLLPGGYSPTSDA